MYTYLIIYIIYTYPWPMFRGLSPRPGITQGTESVRRDLVDLVAKTEVSWTTGGLAGSKSTWKRPARNDPNRPVAGASFLDFPMASND